MRWLQRLFGKKPTLPIVKARSTRLQVLSLEDRSVPTVSGFVIRDYNQNGTVDARDLGVPNIVVSAFDSNGNIVDTATTGINGQYTLTNANTANLRIQFGALPSFLQPGRSSGLNSATQFVNGSTNPTNINYLVNNPADFSQANPFLITPVYNRLDPNGPNASAVAVAAYPYTSSGTPATGPIVPLSTYSQTGSTWGVAWNSATRSAYTAAFMKRFTGFGPNGTGAIYRINPTFNSTGAITGSTVSLFADLSVVLGGSPGGASNTTGTNPHPNGTTNFEVDNTGTSSTLSGTFNSNGAVGRMGLGGIAVNEDNTRMYVMNLNRRSLTVLGITPTGAWDGTVNEFPIPNASTNTDLRPFAVAVKDGQVYIGVVDSAASPGRNTPALNNPNLNAFVFRFNPATSTYTQVLSFPLTYTHGEANVDAATGGFPGTGRYQPWNDAERTAAPEREGYVAQPILTDIAFDASGALIVGIRDRQGDQMLPLQPNSYGTAGDVLRAVPTYSPGNVVTGYTLENAGAVPANGSIPPRTGVFTSNNQGPGGGEFYGSDAFATAHEEVYLGALHVNLGAANDEVVTTAFDPFDTVNSAGVTFNSNLNGSRRAGYELYRESTANVFAKANGIGDVVGLANAAPLEIGNRVWNDLNGNGIQDGNETGISGVTLQLFEGANLVGTTTTNGQGIYAFNETNVANTTTGTTGVQPNTNYQVRIATAQPNLNNFSRTNDNIGTDRAIDSNGTLSGPNVIANVTTGAAGQNNHTIDFGFVPLLSIGNLVFNDLNNNGLFDGSDTGINGVTVELYLNGVFQTSILTQTVLGVPGTYNFTGLTAGNYTVRIPASQFNSGGPLATFNNSAVNQPNPNNGINNDNNGITSGTLGAGGFIETNTINLSADNPTIDFGVFTPHSIGNLIWNDSNNNGIFDSGTESGIANVAVRLLDSTGTNQIATTTTGAGGLYLFSNLPAGSYIVEIAGSNFSTGSALAGFLSSTGTPGSTTGPNETGTPINPNTGTDNIDRGQTSGTLGSGGFVRSAIINLGNDEPTLESPNNDTTRAPDNQSNLIVDFGFYQAASLNGIVFSDLNEDGIQQPGEPGIPGVTVTLTGPGGFTENRVTGPNGEYSFTNLNPGTYTVVETQPAGYGSSTPNTVSGVSVPPNGSATVNFGETTGSIRGRVWLNYNGNSLFDSPDIGLVGVNVTLTGTDALGNTVNRTVQTSTGGIYLFPNVPGGTYTITEGPTNGPSLPPNVDGPDFILPPSTGTVSNDALSLTLGAAQNVIGYNFTEIPLISTGGSVYEDLNANGVRDPLEPGIPGVTVTLTGTNVLGTLVNIPAVTQADGSYTFPNILPSTNYTITEGTVPAPFLDGNEQNGTPPATTVGNDIFSGIDLTQSLAPSSGFNFGEVRPASISGIVYLDRNNNGIQDSVATEPGVPNVQVRLTGTDDRGNPVNLTFNTLANGSYTFPNLRPGTYTVTETQPPSLGDGLDTLGNAGGTVANDVFSNIRLNSGTVATGYNFGENDRIDVRITQTVSNPRPRVGDIISITYCAINDGPARANGTQLTTNLPAGLQFVSANTAGVGAFNPATGVWTIGDLDVGARVCMVVQVRVLRSGTFNNPAAVAVTNFETNLVNNQSAVNIVATLTSNQVSKRRFLSRSR